MSFLFIAVSVMPLVSVMPMIKQTVSNIGILAQTSKRNQWPRPLAIMLGHIRRVIGESLMIVT